MLFDRQVWQKMSRRQVSSMHSRMAEDVENSDVQIHSSGREVSQRMCRRLRVAGGLLKMAAQPSPAGFDTTSQKSYQLGSMTGESRPGRDSASAKFDVVIFVRVVVGCRVGGGWRWWLDARKAAPAEAGGWCRGVRLAGDPTLPSQPMVRRRDHHSKKISRRT